MASVTVWRSDSDLGHLPPVCVVCGEHTHDIRTVRFTWVPGWVWVFLFLGLIPIFIVFQLTPRAMTLHLPVCHDDRGHWFRRRSVPRFAVFVSVLSGLIALILAGDLLPNSDDALRAVVLATLAGPVFALVVAGVLRCGLVRPTRITEETITLTCVSQAFADALGGDPRRRGGPSV